jgi:hypothetical protein
MNLGAEGCGVRIVGFVESVRVPPSRKCVFLTVSFPGEKVGKRAKVDLVAFADTMESVEALGQGEKVQVTAALSKKVLSGKDRKAVQVDGRDAWVLQLIVRTVKTEKADAPEAPPEGEKRTAWESEQLGQGKAGKVDW